MDYLERDRQFRCGKKVRYRSRIEATREAYVLSQNRRSLFEFYQCPYCGWYHVGRTPKMKKFEDVVVRVGINLTDLIEKNKDQIYNIIINNATEYYQMYSSEPYTTVGASVVYVGMDRRFPSTGESVNFYAGVKLELEV